MINTPEQKIGVIIQARMGSTRLPNKVLLELDKNEKILEILLRRMKLSKFLDEIIIATTPDKKNSLIVDVAKSHLVSYFIGSEENVLERYYMAAKEYNLDIIIRITSDCPFVDPKILDDMIVIYKNNDYDYVRNNDETTNFPRGFDIEIFSFKILEKVFSLAKTPSEKEHVTYFIYTHPELFTIYSYNLEHLKRFNDLRLTIDEENDLIICRKVYRRLKQKGKPISFSIYDIIKIIEENPELMGINKNIKQKKI